MAAVKFVGIGITMDRVNSIFSKNESCCRAETKTTNDGKGNSQAQTHRRPNLTSHRVLLWCWKRAIPALTKGRAGFTTLLLVIIPIGGALRHLQFVAASTRLSITGLVGYEGNLG